VCWPAEGLERASVRVILTNLVDTSREEIAASEHELEPASWARSTSISPQRSTDDAQHATARFVSGRVRIARTPCSSGGRRGCPNRPVDQRAIEREARERFVLPTRFVMCPYDHQPVEADCLHGTEGGLRRCSARRRVTRLADQCHTNVTPGRVCHLNVRGVVLHAPRFLGSSDVARCTHSRNCEEPR
jgi:hypothetical protein